MTSPASTCASGSVAMVYQQFINYPLLTGAGKAEGRDRNAGAQAAQLLTLAPYLDRTPLQLSGGQQQRTAIAPRAGQGL
jgi:glycerol transport system ATP-binding protein